MMTHKERVEIWKARIQEAETSGIPIRHWCKEHDIDPRRYYYWHKVINNENAIESHCNHDSVDQALKNRKVPLITEIRFSNTDKSQPLITPQVMIVKNDCQIFVGQMFDSSVLKQVIEVVDKC